MPQFAELQHCDDGQNKHYDVNAKCAAGYVFEVPVVSLLASQDNSL